MTRIRRWLAGTDPFMALSSAALAAAVLAVVFAYPPVAGVLQNVAVEIVARHFSTWLVWMVTLYLLVLVGLSVTPYGRVRLGRDDEAPEFSRFSWFAMLFSAGVGTGILFWGVAEPMFHLQGNPFLDRAGVAPGTPEAAVIAHRLTLFHWGLHGWAVYSMVGLCLSYFAFRKGLPLTVRSALHPLLGDRIYGPLGGAIDLLAVFATLFGIAVSLGLGASQMAAGLDYLFGIEASPGVQLALILGVSAVATVSAVSGVSRGIRRLSELNIWLSVVLIAFLLVAGPTLAIVSAYFFGLADYLAHFLPMGVWVAPDASSTWQASWTIFYWGWWIAWGPFVGMFMARISRGRTLREYVFGTLLVPTVMGFGWLSVFGATALDQELGGAGLAAMVNDDMTQALFRMFELLQIDWATWALALLATVLIVTWFVTSCDSGNLVVCTIICLGRTRPPAALRIFWGAVIGLVAGLLLLAGGLQALQAASTVMALPFSVVLALMLIGLLKALVVTERGR